MALKVQLYGLVGDDLVRMCQGDHYGIQLLDVEFFSDGSYSDEARVTPTGGSYIVESSPNGRDFRPLGGIERGLLAVLPNLDRDSYQSNVYVGYVRARTDSITGATHWRVSVRLHAQGVPGIPPDMIAKLRYEDRMRTIAQTQQETVNSQGDGYTFTINWGSHSPNAPGATVPFTTPAIPGNSSRWFAVEVGGQENLYVSIARRLKRYSGGGLKLFSYVYQTTPPAITGDDIPGQNLNFEVGGAPQSKCTYIGNAPPDLTGAVEISYDYIASTGGTLFTAGGSFEEQGQFFIIPPGTVSVFEVFNDETAAAEARFQLYFAEIPRIRELPVWP